MLRARDIAVGVGNRTLARGVSFAVEPGETLAVVGSSGSGKTMLLRTLVGLLDPLAGEVTLSGKSAAEWGYPTFRRRVVWVAQRPRLFEGTVRDNLERPFRYAVSTTQFDAERAVQVLGSVGLADVEDQLARTLSEGQAARVCLVRALLLDPDALLLDEPTAALDVASRDLVEAALAEVNAAKVIVSHDPDQVARLASRTLDLDEHRGDGV